MSNYDINDDDDDSFNTLFIKTLKEVCNLYFSLMTNDSIGRISFIFILHFK